MTWQRSTSLDTYSVERLRSHRESDIEKEERTISYRSRYGDEDVLDEEEEEEDDYDESNDDDHDHDDDDDDAYHDYAAANKYNGHRRRRSYRNGSPSKPLRHRAYSSSHRRCRPRLWPHSHIRGLCLGVAGTILIFIVYLVRMSHHSARAVEIAIEEQELAKPKPPTWEEFPFLQGYYGGIRNLVPVESNVPEYPRLEDDLPFNASDTAEREEADTPATSFTKRAVPSTLAFDPYPKYKSQEYIDKYGEKVDCFLDSAEQVDIPPVRVYHGIPQGFPDPVMGSAELFGMRHDICYDRFGRLGPYGLGYSLHRGGSGAQQEGEREGADAVWSEVGEVDYGQVKWAEVQQRCVDRNRHRFKELPKPRIDRFRAMQVGSIERRAADGFQKPPAANAPANHPANPPAADYPPANPAANPAADPPTAHLPAANPPAVNPPAAIPPANPPPANPPVNPPAPAIAPAPAATKPAAAVSNPAPSLQKQGKAQLPRTAVVIRTWDSYRYTVEDLMNLRSLISELSILSGAEYTVHFLIQVRDPALPIWSDDETYESVLRESLPEEFHGLGTLWNERQMLTMYDGLEETWMRDLPVHGVYRSTFMPMQYFAYQHPEYDFFWNWELDVRNTGHWYHLFESVRQWTKKQPRKFLWERSSRFYVPSKHGSWDDFSHMVRVQTEQGTNSVNNMWSGLRAGGKEPGSAKQAGDRPIWGPERPLDDEVDFDDDPLPPTPFDKDKYTWGVGEEADLITFNPAFDPDGTTWLLAEDTTGYNTTQGQPPRRTAIITASRLSRRLLLDMHRETAVNKHTMFSEMWPASCALHHGLKVVYAPHAEYIDRKWPVDYLEAVFNGGRNGATGGARTAAFGDREHNFRGTTWYYNAGFAEVLWNRWLGMRFNDEGGEMFEKDGQGRMCLPAMLLHPIKRVELPQEGRRDEE